MKSFRGDERDGAVSGECGRGISGAAERFFGAGCRIMMARSVLELEAARRDAAEALRLFYELKAKDRGWL